jgi:hypothetical protein
VRAGLPHAWSVRADGVRSAASTRHLIRRGTHLWPGCPRRRFCIWGFSLLPSSLSFPFAPVPASGGRVVRRPVGPITKHQPSPAGLGIESSAYLRAPEARHKSLARVPQTPVLAGGAPSPMQ